MYLVIITNKAFYFICCPSYSIDKSKAMALAIHCADISHPSKDWRLHNKWTRLLMDEFFRQVQRLFDFHYV